MSVQKIKSAHLEALHVPEKELAVACRLGAVDAAERELRVIQCLLASYGVAHPRLLESRLRYFECLLDTNDCYVAESGFVGIRGKAKQNTRLYLEATFLLALSLLRQNKLEKAKDHLQEVVKGFNKIKSLGTRRAMQERVVERIEEETLLASLAGKDESRLDPHKVNDQAIALAEKSEDEILKQMGRALPASCLQLLLRVRGEVVLMLPPADRLALPAPDRASSELNLGRRIGGFMKRVVWRTVCAPDSPIYKAWSAKLPEVYSAGYFATGVVKAFENFRIGGPMLAVGVTAILMKSAAVEFCKATCPTPVMETRRKSKC